MDKFEEQLMLDNWAWLQKHARVLINKMRTCKPKDKAKLLPESRELRARLEVMRRQLKQLIDQ